MIYTRTIRTLVGPVKLTIERDGSTYRYRYSVKTPDGPEDVVCHTVIVDEGALHYKVSTGEYLRWIEENALGELGLKLTREIK